MDASLNHHSPDNQTPAEKPARAWSRSEVFCIHSYAGESGPACGWHGLMTDTIADARGWRCCPRCGRATLMKIPAER